MKFLGQLKRTVLILLTLVGGLLPNMASATTYDWANQHGFHFFTKSAECADMFDAIRAQWPGLLKTLYNQTLLGVWSQGCAGIGGTAGVAGSQYVQVQVDSYIVDSSGARVVPSYGSGYWTLTLAVVKEPAPMPEQLTPWNMPLEDGARIGAAILLCWAVAWGFRMVADVMRGDTSEGEW